MARLLGAFRARDAASSGVASASAASGAPSADSATGAPNVDRALAVALDRASEAGRWDVVLTIASELEARRARGRS
jgi:hypothetical protein